MLIDVKLASWLPVRTTIGWRRAAQAQQYG
jgi:hypothetical protein